MSETQLSCRRPTFMLCSGIRNRLLKIWRAVIPGKSAINIRNYEFSSRCVYHAQFEHSPNGHWVWPANRRIDARITFTQLAEDLKDLAKSRSVGLDWNTTKCTYLKWEERKFLLQQKSNISYNKFCFLNILISIFLCKMKQCFGYRRDISSSVITYQSQAVSCNWGHLVF